MVKTKKRLETLRNEVEKAFSEDFMQPQVYKTTWIQFDDDDGTNFVQAEYYEPADDHTEKSTLRGYYGARLSAAGYMDCTDWSVFKTEREALEYLLETYAS